MDNKEENMIQALFEARKNENQRVHERFINAMERRTSTEVNDSKIVETILSDWPEEGYTLPHNQD